MFLEQIVRRQEEQRKQLERKKNMKVGTVPARELDPKKGLRAKDYLGGGVTPDKTMGLKLPGSMHEQMEKLVKNPKIKEKSKKAIARRALEIGLRVLEQI